MGYTANEYAPVSVKRATLQKNRIQIEFKCRCDEFQSLLDFVRGIPGRAFDASTKTWNAPLNKYSVDCLREQGFILDDQITAWSKAQEKEIDIHFPEGLSLYDFQKKGLAELVRLNGRALLADEMGLGKTIQAIAYMTLQPEQRPAIVIVPASLKLNWEREIKKWMPEETTQVIFGCGKELAGNIIIINYDILGKYTDAIRALNPQLVILDEVHYTKSMKAKRTKAVRDICKGVKHIIALSGTPIINRPVEFYNILSLLAPQMFNSFYRFAQEFCAPSANRFGTEYKGASNTEKLNDILKKSFMIRRLKKDVLKDLPAKVRTVIPLEIDNRRDYDKAAEDLIEWLESIGEDGKAQRAARAEAIVRTNVLKQLITTGKLSSVAEWIENFIQEEKLVVFCYHHAAIDLLMEKFGDCAVKLDGRDDPKSRQFAIDEFQNNADIKLFVGNIQAAGVGITLTAASCTAFVELGWTSSEHMQAEDRVHRIGQMADSVSAYYLIGANTIEEDIVDLIQKKYKVISEILDGGMLKAEDSLFINFVEKLRNANFK